MIVVTVDPSHSENMKRCSKCGREYPATAEHFHRQSRSKDGLARRCKVCVSEWGCHYYEANAEWIKGKSRQWRESNLQKAKDTDRRRYEENPERKKASARRYREAHPEKQKEYARRYREANAEKVREINRRWRVANPGRAAAIRHRRRARKVEAGGRHTAEDIRLQYEGQNGRCWWCGCKLDDTYHIDHRIPLARGGSNDASNIVIACPTCNLSKGARLPQEWNGRLL